PREHLARGGVDGLELLPRCRLDPLAVDQHLADRSADEALHRGLELNRCTHGESSLCLGVGRHRRPGSADRSTGLGRLACVRAGAAEAHGGRARALGSAVTGFTDRRVPHNNRTAELRPETIPSVATIDPTETTTTAGGRSAANTRRIAATARRPSATRRAGVQNRPAARKSEASVRSRAAEELAHLVVELLHAGVDGRRLLDL